MNLIDVGLITITTISFVVMFVILKRKRTDKPEEPEQITPTEEELKRFMQSNKATEKDIKKYGDSTKKAITLQCWKGFIRRIIPIKNCAKDHINSFRMWLSLSIYGLHKQNYVFVVLIDPSGFQRPHLIPYNEVVILNKCVYNLEKALRTIGEYGIATWYFHHSSASPINMTESAHEINAKHYGELLKNMQLNAITTNKILKGSRQFPSITFTMLLIITVVISFIYYYYTQGRFM